MNNFKKSKFYIGLALLAQSLTFLVLFFVMLSKKKSIAKTFLLISALGGVSGTLLVYNNYKEIKKEQQILAAMNAFCEDGEDYVFDEDWVDLRKEDGVDEEETAGEEETYEASEEKPEE